MCDDRTIDAVDPRDGAAATLIAALTRELTRIYPDEDGSGDFTLADVLATRSRFLVGSLGGHPVACRAYRPMGPEVAEIKRMYVDPDYRGHGLGYLILHELERLARRDGYSRARLETGISQPEAIRLYGRAGHRRIDCCGIYAGDPRSVCFEKVPLR